MWNEDKHEHAGLMHIGALLSRGISTVEHGRRGAGAQAYDSGGKCQGDFSLPQSQDGAHRALEQQGRDSLCPMYWMACRSEMGRLVMPRQPLGSGLAEALSAGHEDAGEDGSLRVRPGTSSRIA